MLSLLVWWTTVASLRCTSLDGASRRAYGTLWLVVGVDPWVAFRFNVRVASTHALCLSSCRNASSCLLLMRSMRWLRHFLAPARLSQCGTVTAMRCSARAKGHGHGSWRSLAPLSILPVCWHGRRSHVSSNTVSCRCLTSSVL